MADIHFGTDGWRAIIGEDFTDDNLVRVVDAAARVFKEDAVAAGRPADAPGTLIVGHDCRQDAHAYARLAAEVAAAHGFRTLLTQDYCPTPTLCWSVAQDADAVGGIMLMLLLEPLCLHLFGTTPGKRLLGLYVERPDGGRLSYGEAARRTFDVLTYGLGFYVPILSLVLCILSWHKHKEGRPLRWEEGSELRLHRKHLGLLTAGFVALAVFAGFLGFVNEELSQMPKNRGDISAAEFCENYNGLAHMDGYLRSYISLTPGGWERTSMNPTRLEVQGYEAEYSFYETGGVLERLELRLENIPGRTGLIFSTQELELALRSSVWGREGSGVLDFYERHMQLIDIRQMANYGGLEPEDFRLELPSAVVTLELDGGLGSSLGLLMTIELT